MKKPYKLHFHDDLATAANVFIIALHYTRIDASPMKWRMLRLKIENEKTRFIEGLNIDISDGTNSL